MLNKKQGRPTAYLLDSLHEGLTHDLVLLDTDDGRGLIGTSLENGLYSLRSLQSGLRSKIRSVDCLRGAQARPRTRIRS